MVLCSVSVSYGITRGIFQEASRIPSGVPGLSDGYRLDLQ